MSKPQLYNLDEGIECICDDLRADMGPCEAVYDGDDIAMDPMCFCGVPKCKHKKVDEVV